MKLNGSERMIKMKNNPLNFDELGNCITKTKSGLKILIQENRETNIKYKVHIETKGLVASRASLSKVFEIIENN